MANLTYTQIYSMTESELSDHNATNMQESNFEDIISINTKNRVRVYLVRVRY